MHTAAGCIEQLLATQRKDPPRPVWGRAALQVSIQGYLAHKKQHPTLGPPQGPRHRVLGGHWFL